MFRELLIDGLPPLARERTRHPPDPYIEPDWFEPPLHQRARMWNQLIYTARALPAGPIRVDLRTAKEIERAGEQPSAVMRPFALPLSQWEPAPHRKIAHPYGVVALGMLVGHRDSEGTGIFARFQKTPVLLRISLAHPFLGHHPAQIGVAMKFFRWRTYPGHLFCNNPYTPIGAPSSRRRDHWFGRDERVERNALLKKALESVFTSALPDPRTPSCRPKFGSHTALEEVAKGVTAFDVAVEALGSPDGVRATRLSHRDICSRNVDTYYPRAHIPYAVELEFEKSLFAQLQSSEHDLRAILCDVTKGNQLFKGDKGWEGAPFAALRFRNRRDDCPKDAAKLLLQSPFVASEDGDLRLRFPHPHAPDPAEVLDRSPGCPGHVTVCQAAAARIPRA